MLRETNRSVTVSNATRQASRASTAVLTNSPGIVTNVPSSLHVLLPPRFDEGAQPRLNAGRFQFHFVDQDGVTVSDLTRFAIHSTTNFQGSATIWETHTSGLSFTNGLIRFEDATATNQTLRFYRVIAK